MKKIIRLTESDLTRILKQVINEEKKMNVPDEGNNKITKLIDKKLNGGKLTDKEFSQLHNWMIENDDDYRKSVDNQLKKDLKKYVPKGTKIK